jgi:hypothetical protein
MLAIQAFGGNMTELPARLERVVPSEVLKPRRRTLPARYKATLVDSRHAANAKAPP